MENKFISIGDMSNICKVSKRTLRYYDVIGLVKPAYTNEENGYRFYEPYQVGRIHLVKQMQELGISLNDIAECVRESGTEISINKHYLISKKFTGKLNSYRIGKTSAEVGSGLEKESKQNDDVIPKIGSCFYGERNSEGCINNVGFFADTQRK